MDEEKVIDYAEEIAYIKNETGLDEETIDKVLSADFRFLEAEGLID